MKILFHDVCVCVSFFYGRLLVRLFNIRCILPSTVRFVILCFSAFDVSLCGFLKCFCLCLLLVAFVLLFFASSSMFSKCLSVFWFNL